MLQNRYFFQVQDENSVLHGLLHGRTVRVSTDQNNAFGFLDCWPGFAFWCLSLVSHRDKSQAQMDSPAQAHRFLQ